MIEKAAKKTAYRWLMQQAKLARRWIMLTIGISITSGLLLILQAFILAHIIDTTYIHHVPRTPLLTTLFFLLGIICCRALLNGWREYSSFKSSAVIRAQVRINLMKHFMQIGPTKIAHLKTGALTTTVIEQIESLHGFFADYLPQLIIVLFIPSVILIFVFPLDWLAALVLLICAPLMPIFMALIGKGVATLNQQQFKILARLGAQFLDLLQGLMTLKIFDRSKQQINTIFTLADEYRLRTLRVLKIAFLSSGILELFSSLSIAIIAVILGLSLLGQISHGFYHSELTLYKALFILLLAPEFFLPLRQLAVHYHSRAEAIASAHDLLQLYALQSDIPNGSIKLTSRINSIRLEHINFAYTQHENILCNLSFSIQAKEKIAIVGASGLGKSTILQLMAGFISPTEGKILINQHDLMTLDAENWRSQFAMLTQNPCLIHGSIYDNILLAKPQASFAEVKNAAEKALVTAFTCHFPDGLATQVGERNMGLSGGQAQRIALARIFLANKPILLLDEPTAHLDKNTELIILQSLQTFVVDKTVILVSHRPTPLLQGYKIYTLHDKKLTCYA